MQSEPIEGLIAAAFSPFAADGSLDLSRVEPIVEHLVAEGVAGIFVAGTTGEGESLSFRERRDLAAAYVAAVAGQFPVIVQVGRQSLREGRELAAHAQSIRATAVAASAPCFFKPDSAAVLAASMAEIAAGAPELPFYYYHLPRMTGAPTDMPAFLREAGPRIPNLRGIKFSAADVMGFQDCVASGEFDILWGVDEMLLTGLGHGAEGAIGSTYNFAAPVYRRIFEAHRSGDLAAAQADQRRVVTLVDVLLRFGALPAFKALMARIGVPCGPTRLPVVTLEPEVGERMCEELDGIGFFDWGRQRTGA